MSNLVDLEARRRQRSLVPPPERTADDSLAARLLARLEGAARTLGLARDVVDPDWSSAELDALDEALSAIALDLRALRDDIGAMRSDGGL